MGERCCCKPAGVRRGLGGGGAILSTLTLILMPKCPACLAIYVAVWTGVAIPLAASRYVYWSLIVVCAMCLTVPIGRGIVRVYRGFRRGPRSIRDRQSNGENHGKHEQNAESEELHASPLGQSWPM